VSKTVPGATGTRLPATPLDYLEKIFHIPFHLPTMDERGFQTLIDKLTEPAQHDTVKEEIEQPTTGSAHSEQPASTFRQRSER